MVDMQGGHVVGELVFVLPFHVSSLLFPLRSSEQVLLKWTAEHCLLETAWIQTRTSERQLRVSYYINLITV